VSIPYRNGNLQSDKSNLVCKAAKAKRQLATRAAAKATRRRAICTSICANKTLARRRAGNKASWRAGNQASSETGKRSESTQVNWRQSEAKTKATAADVLNLGRRWPGFSLELEQDQQDDYEDRL